MIVTLAAVVLVGCKTKERVVTVEAVRTDTAYIARHERDSIYVHDSIRVHDAGDTVTIERWHTRWRDRWRHDTTYISKTDSVAVPYPVEVEVEAELTWWQLARLKVGDAALMMVVAAVVWAAAFGRRRG